MDPASLEAAVTQKFGLRAGSLRAARWLSFARSSRASLEAGRRPAGRRHIWPLVARLPPVGAPTVDMESTGLGCGSTASCCAVATSRTSTRLLSDAYYLLLSSTSFRAASMPRWPGRKAERGPSPGALAGRSEVGCGWARCPPARAACRLYSCNLRTSLARVISRTGGVVSPLCAPSLCALLQACVSAWGGRPFER